MAAPSPAAVFPCAASARSDSSTHTPVCIRCPGWRSALDLRALSPSPPAVGDVAVFVAERAHPASLGEGLAPDLPPASCEKPRPRPSDVSPELTGLILCHGLQILRILAILLNKRIPPPHTSWSYRDSFLTVSGTAPCQRPPLSGLLSLLDLLNPSRAFRSPLLQAARALSAAQETGPARTRHTPARGGLRRQGRRGGTARGSESGCGGAAGQPRVSVTWG